jgi:hypothetical protein
VSETNYQRQPRLFLLLFLFLAPFLWLASPDPVQAASLRLSWDANHESNLAGYRLHYGTSSRAYTSIVLLGNRTSYVVADLHPGTTYYFAVTAYNVKGQESAFSNEIRWKASSSTDISRVRPGDYQVGPLHVGDYYYTDRDFLVTRMPPGFEGMEAIRPANNEKYSTQAEQLSFTLHRNATIYVAYDARAMRLPTWLTKGFTDTGLLMETTDVTMTIWKKKVSAGTVVLPGNYHGSPAGSHSNYVVLID